MTTSRCRIHPVLSFAVRFGPPLLAALLSLAFAAIVSLTPVAARAGVSDFSGVPPEAIEARDITEALAVPRGTRVEPLAPPTVRLPILFEFDSAALRPEAEALLGKVVDALESDELVEFHFSVEGHTDSVGPESYNSELSRERAAVVKDFLVARGVPEQRLGTRGHGEGHPVAPNDTEEGRQRNRRVELINRGAIR